MSERNNRKPKGRARDNEKRPKKYDSDKKSLGDSDEKKSPRPGRGRPASGVRPEAKPRTFKKSPPRETAKEGEDKKPWTERKPFEKPYGYKGKRAVPDVISDGSSRLNKFLANSGICSRREADELIKTGLVEVNGKPITEMGYRVKPGDEVKYAGEKVTNEKPVYYLLNKPKDYTAVMKFTVDRRNVAVLLKKVKESVFPVGKMDRLTSGLLLFTNDSEISNKLAGSKNKTRKIYHVHLDKTLRAAHLDQLREGLKTKEVSFKPTEITYVGDEKDKKQVGLEILGGKESELRAAFEHLGYQILKLDRVLYAELTKKDLPRGKMRPLSKQEVNMLKMLK